MNSDDVDPFDLHNRACDALIAGEEDVALELSVRAAEAGVTVSMNIAGRLLSERGSLEEAEHWFRAGADSDYRDGVGIPNEPGGYIVPRDGAKLRSPFMVAQLNLGLLLQERGDLEEARFWFERAAAIGHPDAMWRLAVFEHSYGDRADALDWCRRAAEAGDDDAQNTMGIEMARLDDHEAARRWWRLAVENGNTDAAKNLEWTEGS